MFCAGVILRDIRAKKFQSFDYQQQLAQWFPKVSFRYKSSFVDVFPARGCLKLGSELVVRPSQSTFECFVSLIFSHSTIVLMQLTK